MKHNTMNYVWIILIILVTIGCSLSNLTNQAEQVRDTAEVIATNIEEGQLFIETAKAISTQVADSDILSTAKAMATQFDENGFLVTAQAYLTQESPKMAETVQALTTQLPSKEKQPPADIPIIEGDKEKYVITDELIFYIVEKDLEEIVNIYNSKMVENGWSRIDSESTFQNNLVVLEFKKELKRCSITLIYNEEDKTTAITIVIEND